MKRDKRKAKEERRAERKAAKLAGTDQAADNTPAPDSETGIDATPGASEAPRVIAED